MRRRFNPSRPRPGRLVRLGVIVDTASPLVEQRVAVTDASGVEAVWFADLLDALPVWQGGWGDLERLAGLVNRSRVGIALVPDRLAERGFESLARSLGERLEVTLVGDSSPVEWLRRLAPYCRVGVSEASAGHRHADDVVVTAAPDAIERLEARVADLRRAGRASDSGLAMIVPVAIGRTMAEAKARLAGASVFDRMASPVDSGLFGTLEAAQERVIALAHAGVTDLRCIIPDGPDSHDMVAQLTAVAAGTTTVLVPGAPRSPDPPPPEGWGGPRR